jgi:CBS domain-containing protein
MTPGVLTIVEHASLIDVRRAMKRHRVHAVLVVGQKQGKPLGWVTARGLLQWAEGDESLASARDAVTAPPVTIEPGASVHDALRAIQQPGVSHLLVQRSPAGMPEGVVSELDLLGLGAD